MYILKSIQKPAFAKKNSDSFYYRDRARKDCEGIEDATKFEKLEDAEKVAGIYYEVEVV